MTKGWKRVLEILPGFTSWNLILFLFWGGYFFPVFTAYFILAFDVFWVYRGLTLTVAAVLAHFKIRASEHVDWVKEIKEFGPDWRKVKHIIMIMVANEPYEVPLKTVIALTKQTLPLNQIAVVLAADGWSKAAFENCTRIQKQFQKKFGAFLVTNHPVNLPGEIKGKSANEAWAAKVAKRILVDEKKWDMRYLTITSNDADAILDFRYFACLTFKFLDDPDRYIKFWQPAIVFYNNIWKIPAMTRVVNTFGNIWQTGLIARKDRLINFSNYSLSLQLADEVGYWDTDVIPEDYRIFFKAFFAKGGVVEVEPIFLMSSADAPESTTRWKTFVNDYKQKQRWAWGVSDLPLFIQMYARKPGGSFFNKTIRILRVVEDHVLWPINWFFITLGVTIVTFINPIFGRTTLGYALPRSSSYLLSITLIFLVILLIVEYRQRPHSDDVSKWRRWLSPLEFVLMPIAGFFFASLPGLDAHTRLMLGRYLEYRVTEKVG
ncbi:MAG: glycosyltransferase family 2 protein [bacterium]|nr:glycosyltransferase family 2 protein [bacterium]